MYHMTLLSHLQGEVTSDLEKGNIDRSDVQEGCRVH
jgi:hypothetical protein